MMNCPACETDMDVDDDLLQEGSVISCGGCGARCEIITLHPLEIEQIDADDEEDDDEDLDDEDEDYEDEDEEEEEEEDEDAYDEEDDGFDPEDEDE